jgi:hypothetical protein
MSSLTNHLAKTDHHIRELTQRIDLHRNRVARRSKNPALAEQANQLLSAMRAELAELTRYRKRLIGALEVEASLSPLAETPRRGPIIPPYMR